jgi:hypothetical protein
MKSSKGSRRKSVIPACPSRRRKRTCGGQEAVAVESAEGAGDESGQIQGRRMSDTEPNQREAGEGRLFLVKGSLVKGPDADAQDKSSAWQAAKSAGAVVSFDRRELRVIFDLYGAKVAGGEWRDYAMDFTASKAVFSIFRRACETPLYRIEKNPALARRQGAYSVVDASGLILRRGQDLARVVGVLDRKLRLVCAE